MKKRPLAARSSRAPIVTLLCAACAATAILPFHAAAVTWNGTDPGASAISLNGLTDNYDLLVNESVIYNGSNSTRGTATFLGNGWALTARHVIQNGSDYNTLANPNQITMDVFGTVYTGDQFVAFGSSDIALVHYANYTSGTMTNLPGVQRSQIYTGGSESGSLVQIGGFGYWGQLGGTANTSASFHRAFNIASVSGSINIAANGNSRLVNDGYLLGLDQSGDSGSGMWMANGPDQDLDLRDWSLIGVCDTGGTNNFGSSGGYARISNFASTIVTSVFPHAALTWNSNNSTPTAVDGGGTWDLSTARFTDGTNYIFNGPEKTQSVTFGAANGAAGTVTLAANIPVNTLIFNPAGSGTYTIAGGALALVFAPGGAITTNVDATISSQIRGGSSTQYGNDWEITKNGSANLTLTGTVHPDSGTLLRVRAGGLIVDTGGAVTISNASASIANYTGDSASLTLRGSASFTNLGNTSIGDLGGTGTLNLQNSASASFGPLYVGKGSTGLTGTGATGTVNHSAGNLTATTVSLASLNSASVGTYNLSGGVLFANSLSGGPGSSTFNFSGGTLRARTNSTTFMQGLTTAAVGAAGAIIDSNGFNISVNQPLSHSPSAGTIDGGLTKAGNGVLTLGAENTYTGPTVISAGTLALNPAAGATATAIQPVADYSFDNISGSTVVNTGTGGSAMNGALTGGASVVSGGRFGNAVSLSAGAAVNIPNSIADLGGKSAWTLSAWVKTTTPGSTILDKSDGGWTWDNSIFYLGDGTGPGTGNLPSSVRYGRGFVQAATGTPSVVNGAWHLVTYVSTGNSFAIYTDGQPVALSSGNSSFIPSFDTGGTVLLGATTDTYAPDGTVNFNGLLDEVAIYNQALNASQIQLLYSANSPNPAPAASVLPAATPLSIASGATLNLNGNNQTIASLAGPSGAAVALGNGTLTTGDATSTQFAGIISGNGSLIKNGAGSFTLSGPSTYSGGTTLNAGTLLVSNSSGSATGSGNLVLNQGTLGGTGSIAGAVIAGAGPHTIAPGLGAAGNIGTLTLAALTTSANTTLSFSLASPQAPATPSANSLLNVSSPNGLTLDSSTLQLSAPPITAQSLGYYSLIQYAGTFSGDLSKLLLPSLTTGYLYTLDTTRDPSFIDLHLGFLGDANDDGHVDLTDLSTVLNNFGTATLSWTSGNFDGSPTIDLTDLSLVLNNFGLSAPALAAVSSEPTAYSAAAVPEPASLALLLPPLLLLRARRKSASKPRRPDCPSSSGVSSA
ncbi:MAG TPA: LamG-like jellyroll fold domain-containing protein [Phycisphaerae bacterium]|nr:LamG-like jellyroll fold domain-containing protein [Phycisphaerae bacterium]